MGDERAPGTAHLSHSSSVLLTLLKMQKEAIGDYQYIIAQSDELARLRAQALEEAGKRTEVKTLYEIL